MSHSPNSPDLAVWIERIRGREMPVFARTVAALRHIIGDDRASASALAQVILKDAPMTAKVLRLANSAYFNHSNQAVSTVSRAIVVLGFDPVAELALSVALIDSLLAGGLRGRIHVEMARSFHAAVQARWAVRRRGESQAEEVFIAALLSRVGEMAFWCFGGEQARVLERCMSQAHLSEEEAQQVVLGFSLRHLSAGLVREWRLGALAAAALDGDTRSRGPERAVRLGQRLALAAEGGWSAPVARQVLRETSDYVGVPIDTVREEVVANAAQAARIAASFGAAEAGQIIARSSQEAPSPPEVGPVAPAAVREAPDAELQLRILHDLAAMTLDRAPLPEILLRVADGVLRGVACERVVLALLTRDRARLQGRVALGQGAEALCSRFDFPMEGDPDDVLDAAIDSAQACRIDAAGLERSAAARLRQVTGCDEAVLVPFGPVGRQIGVLYADRQGRPFDDEAWRAVQHFALQAGLAAALGALEPVGSRAGS